MDRWEYKVVNIRRKRGDSDEDQLNALGAQGWELVEVFVNGNIAYLKRRLEWSA